MFLKEDYVGYFEELERSYGRLVTLYCEVMNNVGDRAVNSRLLAMTKNNMNAFRYVKQIKEKFKQE